MELFIQPGDIVLNKFIRIIKFALSGFFVVIVTVEVLALTLAPGHILIHPIPVHEAKGPYHGISVYAINLDRAKRRWQLLKPQLQRLGLPYQRVSAVNYKTLSPQYIHQVTDLSSDPDHEYYEEIPIKAPNIACTLSHYKAMQTFLDSHAKYAVIFEDDAKFEAQKLHTVINRLATVPTLWDHVKLNPCPGNKRSKSIQIKRFQKDKFIMMLPMTTVGCSAGYLINRYAARQMLKYSLPYRRLSDSFNSRDWEFHTKRLIVYPTMVVQRHDVEHTREYSHLNNKHRINLQKSKQKRTLIQEIKHGLCNVKGFNELLAYRLKLYFDHYA